MPPPARMCLWLQLHRSALGLPGCLLMSSPRRNIQSLFLLLFTIAPLPSISSYKFSAATWRSSLFFSLWVEKTPIAPLLVWFHMRRSYFEYSLCPARGWTKTLYLFALLLFPPRLLGRLYFFSLKPLLKLFLFVVELLGVLSQSLGTLAFSCPWAELLVPSGSPSIPPGLRGWSSCLHWGQYQDWGRCSWSKAITAPVKTAVCFLPGSIWRTR